ncbi:RNase H domain-containing protein [Trichonephila clavipes]|nr:RNase H domain-containing protein [Trichonephila clavipes]
MCCQYCRYYYVECRRETSQTQLRNSDAFSVFCSKLIAIDTGLKKALLIPGSNSIWILSDRHSATQHLSNWHKVGDNTGVAILEKLKRLSSTSEIHLQWVLRTLTSRAMRLLTPKQKMALLHPLGNRNSHKFRTALHLHQPQAMNYSSCSSLIRG